METLLIKNKSGRVVRVEKTHWEFLVAKEWATVVKEEVPTIKEEVVREPTTIKETKPKKTKNK